MTKHLYTRVEPTAAGSEAVIPEGVLEYHQDTDKLYVSDGTTKNQVYPAAGGGGLSDGDYGDITVSGGSTVITIDNDAVTYAKIQNVTDNRLLGRSAGSNGDVQEITVSTGLSLSGGALAATPDIFGNFGKYHPDREPTVYYAKESWLNNTAEQTWTWGNQGGATETISMDSAYLNAPAGAGDNLRVRWMSNIPASGDFIVVSKMSPHISTANNQCGIILLTAGTTGTPTQLVTYNKVISGSNVQYQGVVFSNYTTFSSTPSQNDTSTFSAEGTQPVYLLMKFTDSSNVISFWMSYSGDSWQDFGSFTTSGNPINAGIYCNAVSASTKARARFYWFRVLNDSSQISDPFVVGR